MNKKKICVVTGTRAEYGLLRPLIERIHQDKDLTLVLVATGMHLSAEFGFTYREIEGDGFPIYTKIEALLSSDTHAGMVKSTGLGMIGFADFFTANRPDVLIALGDRFEMFAAATAAAMMQIPIAHIAGGDTSEGAVDEFLRHSMTKMSYLHFPTNNFSAERIIQMGENPDRVFNVGALNIENILNLDLLEKTELEKEINFKLDRPYALVTFHPATAGIGDSVLQLQTLIDAIKEFPHMDFIITKANADSAGREINAALDSIHMENCKVYTSLGTLRYLSAMKYACLVIGNSSSGIYETPVFGIPCINVGDRQKGRDRSGNIIDCLAEKGAIVSSIKKALSLEFQNIAKNSENIFGSGRTSGEILNLIKSHLFEEKISFMKKFYQKKD